MAKKSSALDHIVQPTRAMTPEQIAEMLHFGRRATKIAGKTKNSARGGRAASCRKAISDW